MIDPEGPVPIYLQLANILADRIESGEFQPNRPLPSEKYPSPSRSAART
jgi:GntR family transcriptional regulator